MMNIDTVVSKPKKDINELKDRIENVYSYLNSFPDVDAILNDEKAKKSIAEIYVYSQISKNRLAFINLAIENGFTRIIVNLIKRNLEILKEKLTNVKPEETSKESDSQNKVNDLNEVTLESKDELPKKENIYDFPTICINIIRNFTNYSTKFSSTIYAYDILKYLFEYLRFRDLVDVYLNSKSKNTSSITRSVIGSILNISKLHDQFIDKWKVEDPVELLLEFSELLKHKDDCQISIYIILANIVNEDEIKKLENLKLVIPSIVSMIDAMSKLIESKLGLKRAKINFDENSTDASEIATISIGKTIWHLAELLDSLYHMAVNDSIKYEIYHENKMDDILRRLIYFGNETEIQYSLKLLWQLCFDQRIAQHVNNDQKFMSKIKEIYESKPSDLTTKNCNGLLWLIDKKLNQTQVPVDNKHIMISYNRETRDLCLKIKQELEKDHYKVWIDVESISGSSLESMADAVENSMCVLMCMTEKYKMSPYCRAEAEYAFQVGKPIVPLIMQANYKPDGWLGIILGSKIFINFTKYDYEECIRRLKSELLNQLGVKKVTNRPPAQTSNDNIVEKPMLPNAAKWTESQVNSWLKEKNIHHTIAENVFPSNGEILHQLYKMNQEAPEFFYKSISTSANSDLTLTTKDIASFVLELKKLFNSH